MGTRIGIAVVLGLSVLGGSAWAQTCGGAERWPVKVGSDPDATLVGLDHPVPTLLDQLVRLPSPVLPTDDQTRLALEQTVRVVQARLLKFKSELGKTGDGDYHLVMTDDTLQFSQKQTSWHSFVAEIVNPACVPGRSGSPDTTSRFQTQLAAVRQKFDTKFPEIVGGWNEADGMPVTVTGIGFYDRPHGQIGRAINMIEIHPVLDIQFENEVAPVSVSATGTPTAAFVNPGFESGSAGWQATAGVIDPNPLEAARTGQGRAWLGGHGEETTDRLSQVITLPSEATAVTLSFYLHISTEELEPQAYDQLSVQVLTPKGDLLRR